MADRIESGTTIGGAVKQVILPWKSSIEVVNRGTVEMWVRFDGVDPVAAGNECFFVAPQGFISVSNPKPAPNSILGTTSNCDVRMLTTANCNYTVSAGV